MPPKKAPWLITGDNYEQWRGDLEEGKSKSRFLSEINQILITKESSIESPKVCIRQKIADLQRSYNNACDFIKNTGEGILAENEADGIHTVQQRILELCPYWDLLEPVMSARSVTEPLHIRSSVGGDQPGRTMETEEGIMNTARSDGPPVPNNTIQLIQSLHDDSDGSELPDVQLYRPSPAPIPQASSAALRCFQVKVAYTKELREHGLPLEEIKRKAAAEFPPLADMDHDKSDESENDSDDSA
ncbi:hypothetical protein KEM48_005694 [Puccinia striiformis f. sp. tritici PST-130]|nr:hypothetical protein KEM48_005694 [Puccinia striiformis f. sp. tritici PST-130]